MNYRHIYHAGNFADIIKHIILIAIILKLKEKEKPFTVLDAFAGIGLYDINSPQALKTSESFTGVKKILESGIDYNKYPELLKILIKILNLVGEGTLYPGSPLIIKNMLRHHDQLIACELHKEDYLILKKLFAYQTNISVHNINAYNALKAFLPFKEKRGLIFLDPPFEVKDEFQKIIFYIELIKKRTLNIPILIWYPIKEIKPIKKFYDDCLRFDFKEILKIEFCLSNYDINMNNCGLLIINPPNIRNELNENLDYIVKKIYDNTASYKIDFLKN